jgi:hypothetical protein
LLGCIPVAVIASHGLHLETTGDRLAALLASFLAVALWWLTFRNLFRS